MKLDEEKEGSRMRISESRSPETRSHTQYTRST